MKTQTLWITAVALCLAACSKQETAEPEASEVAQVTNSEFDEGFIKHMHEHAEKLDDLMFALADGDLEGAATPAYWLSQHDAVDGVPEEWQNYLTGMRNAAYEVELAENLDTARAAAEEISVQCQGCHTAAGVSVVE